MLNEAFIPDSPINFCLRNSGCISPKSALSGNNVTLFMRRSTILLFDLCFKTGGA